MSLGAGQHWTCPLEGSNPAGHVPRRGPGMGILALCPLLGTNTGLIPRRGRGLCAPKKARPAECVIPAAYVRPRGPTLDMSTGGAKSRRACPSARSRDGHIGIMSIARLQHWACPAWGSGSLRSPRKARSAELVNPAAHVPPRGPRMGMSRGAGCTAHPRLPAPSAALSRTSINLRGRIGSRATGHARHGPLWCNGSTPAFGAVEYRFESYGRNWRDTLRNQARRANT